MEIDFNLFKKYFEGRANETEQQFVEACLSGNDHEILDRFMLQVKAKAEENLLTGKPVVARRIHLPRLSRQGVAACALFIVSMGGALYLFKDYNNDRTRPAVTFASLPELKWIKNDGSDIKLITMPDSSLSSTAPGCQRVSLLPDLL